jgi:hypothetical protein
MPLDLQNAFKKNAFDKTSSYCSVDPYKQNEKERKVLDELIFNHFYKKTERQELTQHYIGGPMTLTCHWSEKHQKLIYIFGEEHSEDMDCEEFPENYGKQSGMPIEEYLKKFTQINHIYLDILVELPAFRKKQLKYLKPLSEHEGLANSRLFKIGTEFSECMDGYDRNPQKCSRSRIHYMDIRNIEREAANGLDAVSIFIITCFNIINSYQDLNKKKEELYKLASSELGQELMNGFLIPKDSEGYLEFWNSMLSDNYYVDKELYGNDKNMSEQISNFLKKEIQERLDKKYDDEKHATSGFINEQAKLIIDNYTMEIDPQTIIKYFEDLTYLLIDTNSVIVDAYTLSRIFKKFNLHPENKEKRRTTDEPETASNIIIYAGNNHCNTYRKFLKTIGFRLIADIGKAKSTPRNCIDITEKDTKKPGSDIGWSLQPLFSAWPPPTQPSLVEAESKKDQELKQQFLDEKKNSENDTIYGSFGAAPTDATHKLNARRNKIKPY